ncbi:hypothetical protein GTY74_00645 [Streptomyces sp. SID8350]|nr:hypothetical protein [Streptomyces sp. SID8350]
MQGTEHFCGIPLGSSGRKPEHSLAGSLDGSNLFHEVQPAVAHLVGDLLGELLGAGEGLRAEEYMLWPGEGAGTDGTAVLQDAMPDRNAQQ